MGFSYRQAISEILFAAITCRPDILYLVINLSQYSNNPGEVHYVAVKRVFKYLRDTKDDGLHYWAPTQTGKSTRCSATSDPAGNVQTNHTGCTRRHCTGLRGRRLGWQYWPPVIHD